MKYSEKSGEKITPYQLRHSFATLFLKNGGDVFSLQHLMAHSDLRMTKRYTELDESYIEQQHRSYSPALLLRIIIYKNLVPAEQIDSCGDFAYSVNRKGRKNWKTHIRH